MSPWTDAALTELCSLNAALPERCLAKTIVARLLSHAAEGLAEGLSNLRVDLTPCLWILTPLLIVQKRLRIRFTVYHRRCSIAVIAVASCCMRAMC